MDQAKKIEQQKIRQSKIDKENIEDILSLTPAQEGIFYHYLKDNRGSFYFEQLFLDISGEIDVERFRDAWNMVIANNEILRTVYRWKKLKNPTQVILKEHPVELRLYDFSSAPTHTSANSGGTEQSLRLQLLETGMKKIVDEIKEQDHSEGFDLEGVPFRVTLIKFEHGRCGILISNHHILYDGWSNGILIKEFFTYYSASGVGTGTEAPQPVPAPKTKFKEFIRWIRSRDKSEQEVFWRTYLDNLESGTELPVKCGKRRGVKPVSFTSLLPVEEKNGLDRFCREHQVTLASLIYTAWGLVLQKYANRDDVIFGTAVSGRSARIKGIEDMVGLFINTLPLRVKNRPGDSLLHVTRQTNDALSERERFETSSLVDIHRYGNLGPDESLFDSLLAVENYPLDRRITGNGKELEIKSVNMLEQTHYDLTVEVLLYDGMEIGFTYNEKAFEYNAVERLAKHFLTALSQVTATPEMAAGKLTMLTDREKLSILETFGDGGESSGFDAEVTIDYLFDQTASRFPGDRAITLTGDGVVTYGQLSRRVDALAAVLTAGGAGPDRFVAVIARPGAYMIAAVLAVLKAGAAYIPMSPDLPAERLDYILKDSNASLAITREGLPGTELSRILEPLDVIYLLEDGQIAPGGDQATPEGNQTAPGTAAVPNPGNRRLAYTIYTSGSTGLPKGVLVEHRSVVHLLQAMHERYPLEKKDAFLLKTSFLFDVSVTELFGWFLGGGSLVIMGSEDHKDPVKVLDAILHYSVSHINFVPSMFHAFVELLSQRQIHRLPSLRYIFLAGEELLPGLVRRFRRLTAAYGVELENIYGPTEATVYASWFSMLQWDGVRAIPIGKPLPRVRLYILDRNYNPQPVGVPGELYIAGAGVARGYLNRPELTAELFLNRQELQGHEGKNENPGNNRAPFINHQSSIINLYRTGDLTSWRSDGNIRYLGRIDTQVKVRGFRIELGEIESRLLGHEGVAEVTVTVMSDGRGDTSLCAYIVLTGAAADDTGTLKKDLQEFLGEQVPDYMVPAHFVFLEQMPLTSTGKVARKLLPKPEVAGEGEYIAPRNEIETELASIWADILGVAEGKIGIDHRFFDMGGHSLKATRLMTRIHKEFDIELPLTQLFSSPTIRKLSKDIRLAEEKRHVTVKPVEESEYYPLSAAQSRFMVFQQMNPDSIAYNMSEILLLEGDFNEDLAIKTFRGLLRRHEILRTSFHMGPDGPVQRVNGPEIADRFQVVKYKLIDLERSSGKNKREILDSLIKPFDMSEAPLIRVYLIKEAKNRHYMAMDMHHIISDGTSIAIFIRDYFDIYFGRELRPLNVRYVDYVNWRNEQRDQQYGLFSQEEIERKLLDWSEEKLNLPFDYVRPAYADYKGRTHDFYIEPVFASRLRRLTLEEDVTLFMLLLSAYNIFLSKLSGQETIIVGSPIAGRTHEDLQGIIGLFINTLVLRCLPFGDRVFSEYLQEVKDICLDAFEKQLFHYEALMEKVGSGAESGGNPLFSVMYVHQNMELPEVAFPGIKVTRDIRENRSSKFDLTFYCLEKEGDDGLHFKIEYSTALFKTGTIRRFAGYFKHILDQLVERSHVKIGEINVISPEEKEQILEAFNASDKKYPKDRTVFQAIEDQVCRSPEATAVIQVCCHVPFDQVSLTYNELNRNSNRIARKLRALGVGNGTVVGIMLERSMKMVTAIYSILKAGGTYLPIDPEYPDRRVANMLEQSGAPFLITTKAAARKKSEGSGPLSGHPGVLVMENLEKQSRSCSDTNLEPLSSPEDLIYIIFTSGSTGRPKGAGVYHRSFMNLMHWFNTEFGLSPDDRDLMVTSLSFDLTQRSLYAPLMTGGTLCIPAFNYFEPGALVHEIRENWVTWINCTPSMFHQLIAFDMTGDGRGLVSLRQVFLGGEPINMPNFIDWLSSDHCRAMIVNLYGPTECTDISCSYRIRNPWRFLSEPVPVGKPIFNAKLLIPDKNMQPLPVGVPGELYIGGDGVGFGYINDKSLTAEKFITHSLGPGKPEMRFYRTGDLCKWLPDGEAVYLGRIDHQVKVRGFRIELGEIETLLLSHPSVAEAIVVARDTRDGDKYICAYIVPVEPEKYDEKELREFVAAELPDYMVPAFLVKMERMPLNPNGKIDRKALPEPDLTSGRQYTAPSSKRERELVDIWADVLGIEANRIGVNDNFFQLGGHSLKAAALITRIHHTFAAPIPIGEVFKKPTVSGLAQLIETVIPERFDPYEPVEAREFYPLTSAQLRLYILQQMEPDASAYNMPFVLKLNGTVDRDKLERVFRELIARHESLRTSFVRVDGEPCQRVHDMEEIRFNVEYIDTRDEPANLPDKIFAAFNRPFDLASAPLLRVGVVTGNNRRFLVVTMHHTISDGNSIRVLIDEFITLYRGEMLPPLAIQYKDFAVARGAEDMKASRQFWLDRLDGVLPVLDLPGDFVRPAVKDYDGNRYRFSVNAELAGRLRNLALEEEATLFMVLLTGYFCWLSRMSGEGDIIVGTPVAGRKHKDLEPLIGMFVNTLALRAFPANEKATKQLLAEVKDVTLQAFEHQDYPFEDIVDLLSENISRDPGRNAIFDVMFTLQNIEMDDFGQVPCLDPEPYHFETGSAKFDLLLVAEEVDDRLDMTFEYRTSLFKEETIRAYSRYFITMLESLTERLDSRLDELNCIPVDERQKILEDFNDNDSEFPACKTIHALFEEQAEHTPAAISVVDGNRYLTYGELNIRANQLAHVLRDRGILPDTIAALMVDRSLEMVVMALGVLKSGGAYLPIDMNMPRSRNRYMLDDCCAALMVTVKRFEEHARVFDSLPVLVLEDLEAGKTGNPKPVNDSRDLMYLVYTSGTTGRPKGTLVEHRSLVNFSYWHNDFYDIDEEDRAAQYSPFTFDGSVWDIFPHIVKGAQVHIIPDDTRLDIDKLKHHFNKNRISIVFLTTQFGQQFNADPIAVKSLRNLLIGGEKLLRAEQHNYRLVNNYGPTETTVVTAAYPIEKPEDDYPIGKPVFNNTFLVLDPGTGNLQPIGVPGELCIGGEGVSRGYLNQPELTGEKFFDTDGHSLISQTNTAGYIKKNETGHKTDAGSNIKEQSHSTLNKSFAGGPGGSFFKSAPPGRRRQIFYRTGDLVKWRSDGNIQFVGRIDHQVKIRGFRVELGEIESVLVSHESVKEAAVLQQEVSDGRDRFICAYVVGTDGKIGDNELGSIKEFIENRLPSFMIPSFFISLDRIPLNINGKVDRRALPKPSLTGGTGEYEAPRDRWEKGLVAIWSDVLGIEPGKISVTDDFFQLGGHSLKAAALITRIHRDFDAPVSIAEVFRVPTIRGLAKAVQAVAPARYSPVERAAELEFYPLSSAQERFYVLHDMEPGGTAYNIPGVFVLEGEVDREALETAFKRLIDRHEGFRTSFYVENNRPVQRIKKELKDFKVHYFELDGDGTRETTQTVPSLIRDFIRPFDLSCAPLLRVQLVKAAGGREQRFYLMVDMHHIISDGVSMHVLMHEWGGIYSGRSLEPLTVQYKDVVMWQEGNFNSDRYGAGKAYWLDRFAEPVLPLELPYDYLRPAVKDYSGRRYGFQMESQQSERLRQLAMDSRATPFMVFLTAYYIFLHKLTGQDDMVVGTPVAGRWHRDFENIIGVFINTLALRQSISGDVAIGDFFADVRLRSLEAFEHQEFPYEDLVDQAVAGRDLGRGALYDVMLAVQNMGDLSIEPGTDTVESLQIPGLSIRPLDFEHETAKTDLTLAVIEENQRFRFVFTYRSTLFKPATIQRFSRYFLEVLGQILEQPGKLLAEAELMTKEEKERMLYDFNATETDYPRHMTIHRMFEERVKKQPHRIAVCGVSLSSATNRQSVQLTYHALNRLANGLASQIYDETEEIYRGTGRITGVLFEPSIEMVVAILAILKTGGAFLMLDAEYPDPRIDYMVRDSGARHVLCFPHSQYRFRSDVPCISLDLNRELPNEPVPVDESGPETPVYAIYTSGSTGLPKGVMQAHRNLVHYSSWFSRTVSLTPDDRSILSSSLGFDLGFTPLFPYLISGGQFNIVPKDTYLFPDRLIDAASTYRISFLKVTPSLFSTIAENSAFTYANCPALRLIVMGGEPIIPADVETVFNRFPAVVVINHYGPTETTIGSIIEYIDSSNIEAFKQVQTIGKPICNMRAYILDRYGCPAPPSVTGELYISGAGIAIGYLNRVELTAERFLNYEDQLLAGARLHADITINQSPSSHDVRKGTMPRTLSADSNRTGNRKPNQSNNPADTGHRAPTIEEQRATRRLYKTGDLACWMADGKIRFQGRIDHQVKVRGYRIEIGEIESWMKRFEGVSEAVVVVRTGNDGGGFICGYFVSASEVDSDDLKEFLRRNLPAYMVPGFIVRLDAIPLTANRKLDRKALPVPEKVETASEAPRDNWESMLLEIWSDVLQLDRVAGIDENFFEIGGHSIKAVALINRLRVKLSMEINLTALFEHPTVRRFAAYLNEIVTGNRVRAALETLKKVGVREFYPLSPAQKRLYLLHRIDKTGVAYNMPRALRIDGDLSVERLEYAFRELVTRHEAFRTTFSVMEGVPVQTICNDVEFEIQQVRRDNIDIETLVNEFIAPFDLTRAPLLRVRLITAGAGQYILLMDTPHVISDGVSAGIMIKEAMDLYSGKTLEPVPFQYKDYAAWQAEREGGEQFKESEAYWLDSFPPRSHVPVLNLPLDFDRPEGLEFRGAAHEFRLDDEVFKSIHRLARRQGVTLYMLFLAAYSVLLHRLSGNEDVVIGTPVMGRRLEELRSTIGMFVNTLALRTFPVGGQSFEAFLATIKKKALDAFEYQDYPFDRLVEIAVPDRQTNRNPLFDVMFAFQNMERPELSVPGLELSPCGFEHQVAKFDLNLIGTEHEGGVWFALEYGTHLFKQETVERFAGYFTDILSAVARDPNVLLQHIAVGEELDEADSDLMEEVLGDFEF